MSDDANSEERGLLMPSPLAKTNGGPFDDSALSAGIAIGRLHEVMARSDDQHRVYVSPVIVPQVDLLAMFYGYSLTSEPWDEHPDEWTLLTLERTAGGAA